MAHSYLPVDRDQQFLLPPDVRDWLPEGHLAWFVIDVVERVDTSGLHARHPNDGVGRRAYDPDMLLALLIYAYCTGQRSSRQIERLCVVDVAYRVICSNHVPDHTTIARFRQAHQDVAVSLFTDVLELCAAAGLVSLGVVAVDGTKIGADASLKTNRTRAQIEAEVAAMVAEAAATDAAEDDCFGEGRGDELPAGLTDRRSRRVRLDAALAELKAKQAQRDTDVERARQDRVVKEQQAAVRGRRVSGRRPKHADRVARARADLEFLEQRAADRRVRVEAHAAAQGRRPRGPAPGHGQGVTAARARLNQAVNDAANTPVDDATNGDQDRVNITDPESRIMHSPQGWVQGYNAQAAVTESGIVIAGTVTIETNDVGQCEPMMAATQATLDAAKITDPIGTMLFDAGYWSESNATADGPTRLIATTKSWKLRKAIRERGTTNGPPPPDATPIEAMEHRLRTPEGTALYKKRQHTVEPVFGQIKHGRGFRRFSRRGHDAVQAEWQLITATHNILKLFTYGGHARA